MKKILLQTENRVRRTYRGGKRLDAFLGKDICEDTFYPEDWISSFTEAKNKNYIKDEGISRVVVDGAKRLITDVVSNSDFGFGRNECGVLVKLLDAGERLGIQVHPSPEFALKHFGSSHGKTECWHIISADDDAAVYIGFKEGITKEEWRSLYEAQDIEGMLDKLHRIKVKPSDTILVKSGTPHAIGAGCFLLEIQEPTDYTMRVEKKTVSGDTITPMQIHYGAGEDALFDCFIYEGLSEQEATERYVIKSVEGSGEFCRKMHVTYEDTPCFALGVLSEGESILPASFVTIVIISSGKIRILDVDMDVKRGDKIFVPYGCGEISSVSAEAVVCYPPKMQEV